MNKKIKIYTKTGDMGTTSLAGGTIVPKYHLRVETYGTLDELNSFIGLVRDHDVGAHNKDALMNIQRNIFILESIISEEKESGKFIPAISPADIEFLEKEIDAMNEVLPELTSFIIPGGHPLVSYCHIARCVCRRAERLMVRLKESTLIDPLLMIYINRLSDYLFVLARSIAKDLGVGDVKWANNVK